MSLNDITTTLEKNKKSTKSADPTFEEVQNLKGTPYAVVNQINYPLDYSFEKMQNLIGNETPADNLLANSAGLGALGALFGLASKIPYGSYPAAYFWVPGVLREFLDNPYVASEIGAHGMDEKGRNDTYVRGGSNITDVEDLGDTFVAPGTSASYFADALTKFSNPLLFFGTPMASDVVRFTGKELDMPALEHIADSLNKVGKFSLTKGIRDFYNVAYDPNSAYSQRALSRRDSNYDAYEKDISHLIYRKPWFEWWKAIPYAADYLYTDLFTEENYKNKE